MVCDPLPSAQTYEENKLRESYDTGEVIAGVPPPGSYYEDIETIEPTNWVEKDSNIDIQMNPAVVEHFSLIIKADIFEVNTDGKSRTSDPVERAEGQECED